MAGTRDTRAWEQVEPEGMMVLTNPASWASRAGDFVFLAGHMPKGPDGQIVEGGFGAQARMTFDNLGRTLTAAGCNFADVAKLNVYLADLGNFDEYNGIFAEYFSDPYPARTTVAAGMRGFLIEVDGVAVRSREAEDPGL